MDRNQVEQAILGDKLALETILTSCYEQLYRTAFLYVKNQEDALDVVQESVIKIMTRISTLKNPQYFVTWAVRIVIFGSLDFLRKHQKEVKEVKELSDNIETIEPLSKSERLDVHSGIKKLPVSLQEIVILFYFNGSSIKEISEIIDEPVGTIKYKLHHARRILKEYLEGGKPDETIK